MIHNQISVAIQRIKLQEFEFSFELPSIFKAKKKQQNNTGMQFSSLWTIFFYDLLLEW